MGMLFGVLHTAAQTGATDEVKYAAIEVLTALQPLADTEAGLRFLKDTGVVQGDNALLAGSLLSIQQECLCWPHSAERLSAALI